MQFPQPISRRRSVVKRRNTPIGGNQTQKGSAPFEWEGFFWVGAIRLVNSLHMQCLANSLTHLGEADEGDSSTNLWWLGPFQLTAWGENWHRNHHSNVGAARLSGNGLLHRQTQTLRPRPGPEFIHPTPPSPLAGLGLQPLPALAVGRDQQGCQQNQPGAMCC